MDVPEPVIVTGCYACDVSAKSSADITGQLLGGRYRVLGRIGQGGMGVVYEAVVETLGRHVAIKVLRDGLVHNPTSAARFVREARAAASLQHPNIVSTFDFVSDPGAPSFFVMELLQGTSMRELLRVNGPLPVARLRPIVSQVLSALAVAHAAGIVHRDIKPDNIFVTPTATGDVVKLLDFGIARVLAPDVTALTQTGMLLGTASYLAPEVARGEPADARSDLYSVGGTAYTALSGQRPFGERSITDLIIAAINERPVPLAKVWPAHDVATTAFIERLMAQRPEDRFPSAEAALDALSKIGGSENPRSNRPVIVLAAALAFCGALAFGLLWFVIRTKSASPTATGVAAAASSVVLTPVPSVLPEASVVAPSATTSIAAPEHTTTPRAPTARRATGVESVGAVSTSFPVSNAQGAIARLRPGFRACYNAGLASDPTMSGKIVLLIKVGTNGDVEQVAKGGGSGLSSDVEACIMNRARSATFVAPGGDGSTVNVPVTFVPQAPGF